MSKARSRLNLEKLQDVTSTPLPEIKPQKKHTRKSLTFAMRYLKHSPTLVLSLPFFFIVGFLLTKVKPDIIKNLVWTNSYFVFIVPFFLAFLFFFSFIFLKTRRGFVMSCLLTTIVFLKLQQVVISLPVIAVLLFGWFTPLLIIESFIRLLTKK